MIYLITPLCRKCITPSPQLSQLLRYAAAKQQETTIQQDLGVAATTQGKLLKMGENHHLCADSMRPPRRLGWTRYHDADQHWHRIVEHLRCGLKNLKKNIDLFFSLFLFKGVWKFLVSNIFWSPPISWWLQWLQNCQPPSFWEKRNLYSQRVAYSRCIRGSEVSPTSFTGLI